MGFAWLATPSFLTLCHADGKRTAEPILILSCEQSTPKTLARDGNIAHMSPEDNRTHYRRKTASTRHSTSCAISGSSSVPDAWVEQLLRYHERLGANHLRLRVQWAGRPQVQVLEAIEWFGERVIPRLRDV
jgi:hypothetical protein